MTTLLRLWLVIGLVLAGCGDSNDAESSPHDGVSVMRQALTTLSTFPADSKIDPFGAAGQGTPAYGETITVPATDVVLRDFTFEAYSLPASLGIRGELYAWDGAKASGPNLFESATVSTTGPTQQQLAFNTGTGGVALTPGSTYILFITSLGSPGSGSGGVTSRSDNPYAGGSYFFSQSTTVGGWTNVAWGTIANADLAFTATLVPIGSTASTTTLASSANPSVYGQALTYTATVASAAGTPSGRVTFRDGATVLGSVRLNAAGQASFAVSLSSVGGHSITASYSGSSIHAVSASGTLSQTVSRAATALFTTPSANPIVVGGQLSLSATVVTTSPGRGVATGSVAFSEGPTSLGSATLDGSGRAVFSTSSLSAGSHTITASYAGTTNYAGSSAGYTQVVNRDGTTLTLTSSASPSTYGSSVVLRATVAATGPSGVPTGATISYSEGGTLLGTAIVDASGVAALTISALGAGNHAITASYGGDSTHTGATGSFTQVVNAASSTTALVSTVNPSLSGQATTLTATVRGAGTLVGSVAFFDGGSNLGSVTLNGAGQASFAATALTVGTHSLTAVYGGTLNHTTSTSSALSQLVNKASSSTTLASSSSPAALGASVTLTATVRTVSPGAGTPSGTVTFAEGATVLGTATLDGSGVASLTTSSLAIGTHAISAAYAGSTSLDASTSAAFSQVITQAGTSATLSSSKQPAVFGDSVTFTATLTASSGGVPTGSITFLEGATTLGTGSLDASGVATFSTATLSAGAHTIAARYDGDANHSGVSSASLSQTIDVAGTSTTLASNANPALFGQPVTLTASVSSAAGVPTGSITFTDGVTTLGSANLDASGVATYSSASLAVATHAVTASFSGDANFAASTASALSQEIIKATTSVGLTASANPATVDQTVTLTALVMPVAPGAGAPTGSVTFKSGSDVLGTAEVSASGVATLSRGLALGTVSVSAEYAGDGSFTASTSSALSIVVSALAVRASASATPNPGVYGSPVTLTLSLTGDQTTPTGSVGFREAASALGSANVDGSGVASSTIASLGAGTHSLEATYSGDATYGATTAAFPLVVQRAPTRIQLTSSLASASEGQDIAFTATVSADTAGFGGGVQFFDADKSLGTVTLSGAQATFTTKTLAAGGHTVTASYTGDENFSPSTATLQQAVQAAPQPPVAPPTTGTDVNAATVDGGGGCNLTSGASTTQSGSLWLVMLLLASMAVRRRRACYRAEPLVFARRDRSRK